MILENPESRIIEISLFLKNNAQLLSYEEIEYNFDAFSQLLENVSVELKKTYVLLFLENFMTEDEVVSEKVRNSLTTDIEHWRKLTAVTLLAGSKVEAAMLILDKLGQSYSELLLVGQLESLAQTFQLHDQTSVKEALQAVIDSRFSGPASVISIAVSEAPAPTDQTVMVVTFQLDPSQSKPKTGRIMLAENEPGFEVSLSRLAKFILDAVTATDPTQQPILSAGSGS